MNLKKKENIIIKMKFEEDIRAIHSILRDLKEDINRLKIRLDKLECEMRKKNESNL